MTKKTDKNNRKPAELLLKDIDKKQRAAERKSRGEKGAPRGKPFEEGFDERRNTKGSRPRTLTLLREMILDMSGEEIEYPDPLNPGSKDKTTAIYYMLRKMMLGKAPADHMNILAYGFGKIPDETRNLSAIDEFVTNNLDLFTDGQLERIKNGEDKASVLSELLINAAGILRNLSAPGSEYVKKKKK